MPEVTLFQGEALSDFDAFWAAVPLHRKVAKVVARKAFARALKKPGVTAEMLIREMTAYADRVSGTNRQYVLHPASWLNQERWDDDYGDPTDPRNAPPLDPGAARLDRLRRFDAIARSDPSRGGQS
jgi:hypothetical protein